MLVNAAALEGLFKGFSTSFNKGLTGAASRYGDVAMLAPSSTGKTVYAWLGQLPRMREWLGDRIIKDLAVTGYTVENRTFESTVSVARKDIEDDQYGVYGPLFTDLGRAAGEHPDELIFNLLESGFETTCYDGQNFFDAEHPVRDASGETVAVSNVQDGAGPAWYLLDTSRAVRPLIFQERLKPVLTGLDRETDGNVFFRDKYIYGTRARANAGFGLWQLAFGSKAALTPDNYAAARQAMMALRGDEGRILGVKPDTLVVPPTLEQGGLRLINNALGEGGATNEWAGTAKLIVTPWLGA